MKNQESRKGKIKSGPPSAAERKAQGAQKARAGEDHKRGGQRAPPTPPTAAAQKAGAAQKARGAAGGTAKTAVPPRKERGFPPPPLQSASGAGKRARGFLLPSTVAPVSLPPRCRGLRKERA